MIKSIRIQNFQSHKDSILDFEPGVNIIIGRSDSGKSAILRAINLLTTNRPSGDSYRSNWGGVTKIEMDTDDAYVARIRSDTNNEYILGDSHFKAIKTDVPQEILDALNMSEINVQRQLDSPFLLSETSGEVAKHFNKIARLDKIDTATLNVNSAIREIERSIKYKESDLKTKEESLKEYDYLDKFEAEVEALEQLEEDRKQAGNKLSKINTLINEYQDISNEISECNEILKYENQVNHIIELIDSYNYEEEKYRKLVKIVASIQTVENRLEEYNKLLRLENEVVEIINMIDKRNALNDENVDLMVDIRDILAVEESIGFNQKKLTILQNKFEKEFPNVCPLCGTELK